MACLWFCAGNSRNLCLWRRRVLYKTSNQSKPSTLGGSKERVTNVWPGTYTRLDTKHCKLEGKIMSHDKKGEQKSRLLLSCYRPLFSISLIQGCYHVFFPPVQMDESMPLRFDEGFLRWVAGEQSLKDTSFLSNKVLGLCGELPIYWLHPTFTKGFLSLFILCLKQTAFPEKLVHFVKKH